MNLEKRISELEIEKLDTIPDRPLNDAEFAALRRKVSLFDILTVEGEETEPLSKEQRHIHKRFIEEAERRGGYFV
jgi:hypothetical protein